MNTHSSTRRLRHREADLAGLLESADRVFSEKGYHATSIRDIAREAGFSVGGVYQFFTSKDELYLRVVESQWEFFFRLLDETRNVEGARAKLEALTAAMFRTFEERRGFFRFFLAERGRLTAAFSDLVAEGVGAHTRRLREQLVELMRQGVEEGTLGGDDPAMLASAYTGMVHNYIFEALASGGLKPSRTPGDVLSLFLDGASGGGTPRHGASA